MEFSGWNFRQDLTLLSRDRHDVRTGSERGSLTFDLVYSSKEGLALLRVFSPLVGLVGKPSRSLDG